MLVETHSNDLVATMAAAQFFLRSSCMTGKEPERLFQYTIRLPFKVNPGRFVWLCSPYSWCDLVFFVLGGLHCYHAHIGLSVLYDRYKK